jgi:hypothetical protein
MAGKLESKLRTLCVYIESKIHPIVEKCVLLHYNGINIAQAHNYVKLHVVGYISKILGNHGWETGTKSEYRSVEPLRPRALCELEEATIIEDAVEAKNAQSAAGFEYCGAIHEWLYALVTYHLNIGYTMAELSKFSTCQAACLYAAAKRVYRYLHQTKDVGIAYYRAKSRLDLPHLPLFRFFN